MDRFSTAIVLVLFGLLASAGPLACGDDPDDNDDNQTNNADNQQDDSPRISEMSDDDVEDLCDDVASKFDDVDLDVRHDAYCSLVGFTPDDDQIEDPQGECQNDYDDCMDEDFNDGDEPEVWSSCLPGELTAEQRETCDATYNQVIACHEEINDAIATFADEFSCDELDDLNQMENEVAEEAAEHLERQGPACAEVAGC